MSKTRQFLALSGWQKRALVLAWVGLPLCQIGLRYAGLAKVHAWVLKRPLKAPSTTEQPALKLEDMRSLGTAVNRAARYPMLERACLRRSLVLLWLLRRQGVCAQLRIGVRFVEGALDAHAWVEWQGHPLNDKPDVGQDFAVFGDIPPLAAFHSY